ncbi:MAG: ATP-binding protein [Syntrophomonadaceae bacterium]
MHQRDDFICDIKVDQYPGLNQACLNLLKDGFQSGSLDKITTDAYNMPFPNDFIKSIEVLFDQDPHSEVFEAISDLFSKFKLRNQERHIGALRAAFTETNQREIIIYFRTKPLMSFFDDVYELWKNKQILDKQSIYLYFGHLKYDQYTFPLFYIPVQIDFVDSDEFSLDFDPILLVNKKAIEFVTTKWSEQNKKDWKVDLPLRQLYLSNYERKGSLLNKLQETINEITNYTGLGAFDLNQSKVANIKLGSVELSNQCYLSIFDNSDEALVNDYEELLQLISQVSSTDAKEIFEKISTDFLFENPQTFDRHIDTEYESKSVDGRLAYMSPISLNREQQQVLSAINTPGCDRIIIEGPPGTGKSHTITAIIYNALLEKKSVLMVSDKKEALDVVEEKINQVLDKMKLDDFIQNPILRLGKKDTNYSNIFKPINYDKIKMRHNSYLKYKDKVEKEIVQSLDGIKHSIQTEVAEGTLYKPQIVNKFLNNESAYNDLWDKYVNEDELFYDDYSKLLPELLRTLAALKDTNRIMQESCSYNCLQYDRNYGDLTKTLRALKTDVANLWDSVRAGSNCFSLKSEISSDKTDYLAQSLNELEKLKKPIIGLLFSGKQVQKIEEDFRLHFINPNLKPIRQSENELINELKIYRQIKHLNDYWQSEKIDFFDLFRNDALEDLTSKMDELISNLAQVETIVLSIPKTQAEIGINWEHMNTLWQCCLELPSDRELDAFMDYFLFSREILAGNRNQTFPNFIDQRRSLENRLVQQMTNILDESVIDFRESYKNDAENLRKIISAKKKIPKNLLKKLVDAFPCLIIGIRELGDYIPLEADIFDIVIIDEASQVSIAQAFPAVLRGKKIVILGDPKQYSNVKSHNASSATNSYLFNQVRSSFAQSIMCLPDDQKLNLEMKVESFNIKNSILDFMVNLSNYHCTLKKHFRGYMEIIGFSNDTFYNNSLQVMKIRGIPVSQVIKFMRVDLPDKPDPFKNTNLAEAQLILEQLESLRNSGYKGSVGIITPFTNQQKLISNHIYASTNWKYYTEQFNLKIMTFDSCQGDEKDIIYYSMVEKEDENLLNYIFPVDLKNIDLEGDGTLKSQRLNVGLSRAKESIRFVISKDVTKFNGSIGKALNFFNSQLISPDDVGIYKKMDTKSPMEPMLYNALIQTQFYKQNKSCTEIIPQFNLGKYIKQLDPMAVIPNYRTDFLVIYNDGSGKAQTVILEYDGFEYHFKDVGFVDETNFDRFYVEQDVERRKAIESYGYSFIRCNKFIMRGDPVEFLNEQLTRQFSTTSTPDPMKAEVQTTYNKIENGEMKLCTKCGNLRPIEYFYDSKLKTKYGRVCWECKKRR